MAHALNSPQPVDGAGHSGGTSLELLPIAKLDRHASYTVLSDEELDANEGKICLAAFLASFSYVAIRTGQEMSSDDRIQRTWFGFINNHCR